MDINTADFTMKAEQDSSRIDGRKKEEDRSDGVEPF
jgi:hypothetical protein